jgi:hypothetical protein
MRNVDELHQPKNVGSVSIELATQPCRIALRCIEGGPLEIHLPMPPNARELSGGRAQALTSAPTTCYVASFGNP